MKPVSTLAQATEALARCAKLAAGGELVAEEIKSLRCDTHEDLPLAVHPQPKPAENLVELRDGAPQLPRTYKLAFGTTSEPGRIVKSLGEPRGGLAVP